MLTTATLYILEGLSQPGFLSGVVTLQATPGNNIEKRRR